MINAVFEFYDNSQKDANGRFRSWEYCYYNFYKARKEKNIDIDYLSLQLAFYLASWGMYRGSSFILEKDYKVHIPIVEEILKPEYDDLFNVDCGKLLESGVKKCLMNLKKYILEYYEQIRCQVKGKDIKNPISSTLVTKILMGTLGCVPAYDEYFTKSIKEKKAAIGTFNDKSITQLAKFYMSNYDEFERVRQKLYVEDIQYPQMKLLDMGFWQLGKKTKEENGGMLYGKRRFLQGEGRIS